MISLVKLPEIIFKLIEAYLSYDDYHYLLNTSKKEFEDLKRRTIVFRLTPKRSIQYMSDKEFQSLLLSKVEDGWKQIRITGSWDMLVRVYNESIPHDGIEYDSTLYDFDELGEIEVLPSLSSQVREIDLDYYVRLKDISTLSTLPKLLTVEIYEAEVLEDISPLKDIPNLAFHNCLALSDVSVFRGKAPEKFVLSSSHLLTDVSGLSNVRTLSLSSCHRLRDVSPLYGVYDLSIISCENVKDISGLGNHHGLNISDCSKTLTGYEVLVGIPHVKLGRCDISDVSVLRYAKSIKLKQCNQITDIRSINKVKSIVLDGISSIKNISELSDVYDLSLLNVITLTKEDILKLRNYKLQIQSVSPDLERMMENSSFLASTKHFTWYYPLVAYGNLIETHNIPFFRHLQTLVIDHTTHLTRISGLEEVPTVKLSCLDNLTDITGLGRNRLVELVSCPKVKDVSSLANVNIVRIKFCVAIEDYSVLSRVPRLKIIEYSYHQDGY